MICEWWQGPFDSEMDDYLGGGYTERRIRRGKCTCATPDVSARPAGRMRHEICRRCNGSWSYRIEEFEREGKIIYGIRGKHRQKRLWAERLREGEVK